MSTARYIGRVSGMAALGAGAAIVIGGGVAAADAGSEGTTESSGAAQNASGGAQNATGGAQNTTGAAQKAEKPKAAKGSRKARDPGAVPAAAKPNKWKAKSPANADSSAATATTASAATQTKPDETKPDETTPAAEVVTKIAQPAAPTEAATPPATTDTTGADAVAVAGLVGSAETKTATTAAKVTAASSTALAAKTTEKSAAKASVTVNPAVTLTDGVIAGTTGVTDSGGVFTKTYAVTTGPDKGGVVYLDDKDGTFYYVPDSTTVNSRGKESFAVTVTADTPQVTEALAYAASKSPEAEAWLAKTIAALRANPVVGKALIPTIGYTRVVPITVDIAAVVPVGAPVTQNIVVTSFDGTKILTHFFPASGLAADTTAPTILYGPGLAQAGDTDPYSVWSGFAGVGTLRANGYNVVTWDPRGEYGSGGVLHLDSPDFEARDVSAIIDMVSGLSASQNDPGNDPRLGMVGGSYGGGIQLVTAAQDHRIDAIVPGIAWNSLLTSLYQDADFKTMYAALLALGLVTTGADVIPDLYTGLLSGALTGKLSQTNQDLLAASSPNVGAISAPTLLIQGTVDTLFPLDEAMANAAVLAQNGVPVKMLWFCGGHGSCLSSPGDPSADIEAATLAWLARYVKKDETVDTGPTFEWVDQNGQHYSSNLLPTDPGFDGTALVVNGPGGTIALSNSGGSGPAPQVPVPYGLTDAAKATNAINVLIPAGATATNIVGSPVLKIAYSGTGTATHVYAQIVDNTTDLVLGNLVTPIPVVLDGTNRTAEVPLEAVAQLLSPGQSLTLQITGSATPYLSLFTSGTLTVTSVTLTLPTAGAVLSV